MTDSIANILLVDDDSRFLMAMEETLAGPGRMIFKAESGNEALRHLLEHDFSLILLDVRMPGMDGFETAALIRQRERSRYIPLIFISGLDTLGKDVMQGMSSGAIDYIFKPFSPQHLKSRVSILVDLFHLHERLKRLGTHQTEESINGFSIPMRTICPGLLLLLITGLIDKQRFDQLEKRLLKQISATGAKIVVIDVTAASIEADIIIPIKILVEVAQLMGARIIFTGSNTSISNAKFITDINLEGIFTNVDLQTGIQEAERMLGK